MLPNLYSKTEIYSYFSDIYTRLQRDAINRRWEGIQSKFFNFNMYDDEISVHINYVIENVGNFHISLYALLPHHYNHNLEGIYTSLSFSNTYRINGNALERLIKALINFGEVFRNNCQLDEFVNPDGFCIYDLSNCVSNETDCYTEYARLLDLFIYNIGKFRCNPVNPEEYMSDAMKMFVRHIGKLGPYNIITDIDELNEHIENGYFKK